MRPTDSQRKNAPGDPDQRTVALVEWNRAGHHQTYFTRFASALLELGVRVVPFCPWPEELGGLMAGTPAAGNPQAMARLEPPERCLWPTAGWVRPESLKPLLCALKHFQALDRRLARWERTSGVSVDLVFFCCIHDQDFRNFRQARWFFRRPWAGLYLDSRAIRLPGTANPYNGKPPCPERILNLPGLHAVCHLDEGILAELGGMTNGRPVVWMPDVADNRLPQPDPEEGNLGRKIRDFAGGRKVVGCIGHLQKTKGLLNLVRAVADPRLQDVCMVFVGEVNWYPYTAEEQEEIMVAWEGHPRIFCHPLRVPDERRLNSAVAACDVIAAAYTDFPNSSNMLTKAAAFGKPVVVNDGHLMGERVREYQLGLTVPEGDFPALVEALVRLTSGGAGMASRREEFSEAHSYDRLKLAFEEMLANEM